MPLPPLSTLQFAVMRHLHDGEISGRDLRIHLCQEGISRTPPAFYQLMARLEEAGFVTGRYTQEVVLMQAIKERRYTITPAGQAAWHTTLDFFATRSPLPQGTR